uniref:Secreted protein n=1 Tax=Globodera pallida TaxID=36090 RepID=A0A183CEZ9_GLOPA
MAAKWAFSEALSLFLLPFPELMLSLGGLETCATLGLLKNEGQAARLKSAGPVGRDQSLLREDYRNGRRLRNE